MIKALITTLCFLSFSTIYSQTIKELEYDLSWSYGSEKYVEKIGKARKLQSLDPFNYKAADHICRYYQEDNIDSISIYFDNLISSFPDNIEPYLLRTELLYLEYDYRDRDNFNKQKIKYLNKALRINAFDKTAIYRLAEVYYKDFIFPMEKEIVWGPDPWEPEEVIDTTIIEIEMESKHSTFDKAADSALLYFYKLWDLNHSDRDVVFYPIRQLECYLNKLDYSRIPVGSEDSFNQCYFPSWYFADLSKEWQCDFSVNYLFKVGFTKDVTEELERQLADLEEECLFDRQLNLGEEIYRFTWLRSFHHPIAIRIENTNNKIFLYWKVGKGNGGYEPKGLKKSGKKKLSLTDWENFQVSVAESKFDSLPNRNYIPSLDGASWTLERKTSNGFKAHYTNSPYGYFEEACLFLVRKTSIRIKENHIY